MPSISSVFRIWLGIGIQSFGGGTTTLVLIRRTSVDLHGWTTDEQFNRHWALCQMTPGINLIGLTIVIGKQIAGWRGIAVCLAGLLLPSALLTGAITAGFLLIKDLPVVKGALAGILPSTVGLGLVTACQMSSQPLRMSWNRSWRQLLFALFLLVGSGAVLWSGKASVTVVLLAAGLLGALESYFLDLLSKRSKGDKA